MTDICLPDKELLSSKIDTNVDVKKIDSEYEYDVITDLQALIRQPSVSAKNQGLIECANLVVQLMRKAGINAKLLYVDDNLQKAVEDDDIDSSSSSPPPIVYGEVRSK